MDSSLENISKQELIERIILLEKEKETLSQEKETLDQKSKELCEKSNILESATAELEQKTTTLQQKYDVLKHQYEELRRLVFGTKRERFIAENNPHQQTLPFEVEEPVVQQETEKETVTYERNKKRENHHGRIKLPDHLPVEEVIIEPDTDTTNMVRIGEEVTEELEHNPARLFIRRIIRPKYARKQNELENTAEDQKAIIIADLPARPIEKCKAGTGLLAQVMVDKFVDHLPFYRQIERYKREGVEISSSTIDGWQRQLARLLEPLYEELKRRVLAQGYLQADESPVKVLDKKKKGKTHTGYHWVYYSPLEQVVLFDYRSGRGREGPQELLKDFKGYLQTDGYSVYDEFNNRKNITLTGCMAHARRYFDKALDNDKARTEHVLTQMQELYAIERKMRQEDFSHKQRHAYRLDHAQPILEDLIKWLIKTKPEVVPASAIGKAIDYALKRWDYLKAYLYDGALEIDNNLVENSIRTLAIGRKNYLFAGSHNGAKRAAMFYSFFGTCKKHGINPYAWLRHVLEVIPDTKTSQLAGLLPQNFKPE